MAAGPCRSGWLGADPRDGRRRRAALARPPRALADRSGARRRAAHGRTVRRPVRDRRSRYASAVPAVPGADHPTGRCPAAHRWWRRRQPVSRPDACWGSCPVWPPRWPHSPPVDSSGRRPEGAEGGSNSRSWRPGFACCPGSCGPARPCPRPACWPVPPPAAWPRSCSRPWLGRPDSASGARPAPGPPAKRRRRRRRADDSARPCDCRRGGEYRWPTWSTCSPPMSRPGPLLPIEEPPRWPDRSSPDTCSLPCRPSDCSWVPRWGPHR